MRFAAPVFHPAQLAAAVVTWLVWMIPFVGMPKRQQAQTRDRRARWGIVLEGVGFACIWAGFAWEPDPGSWRWAAALPFLIAGPLLSWTSARTLGKQWRFDAASGQLAPSAADLRPEAQTHGNALAFATLGTTLPGSGLSLGASIRWAKLRAIDGVDMLYPGSTRVEQFGETVHASASSAATTSCSSSSP